MVGPLDPSIELWELDLNSLEEEASATFIECMYVFMYVCMYVCMYACMFIVCCHAYCTVGRVLYSLYNTAARGYRPRIY